MSVSNLEIELISSPAAGKAYEGLVPGHAEPWFEGLADGSRIGVGGTLVWESLDGPTGVALATAVAERRCVDLNWIYVRERYRRRGVATALLARLEESARRYGCDRIGATYSNVTPGRAVLRRFLEDAGWVCREPAYVRATGGPAVLAAPWIAGSRLPSAFEMVAWSDIESEERARLEANESVGPSGRETYGFPSPFARSEVVEPRASFWIRHRGELVGWLKGVRVATDAVEFSTLYVHPAHQRSGRAIQLLAHAIRNVGAAGYQTATFMVDVDNRPMLRFVKRRLEPFGVVSEEIHRAQKTL